MLVVLVEIDGYAPLAPQETLAWVDRVFNTGNHDGRGKNNSIKKYYEQQSYGSVIPQYDIYPQILHLTSAEVLAFRDLTQTTVATTRLITLIADKLVAAGYIDPANNPYDCLIALGSGWMFTSGLNFYTIKFYPWRYQGFNMGYAGDLPVHSSSPMSSTRYNEAIVVDAHGVVPLPYNSDYVYGVWLASDTLHTGTNYYLSLTDGVRDTSRPAGVYAGGRISYVKLNAVLAPGTNVIVNYIPRVYLPLATQPPALPSDSLVDSSWFGVTLHEMMHAIANILRRSTRPATLTISDVYQEPFETTQYYDMMSYGSYNKLTLSTYQYSIPTILTGHSRKQLGFMQPYTLTYGENETNIRLWQTTEDDFTNTGSRIKLIKVPLQQSGQKGYRSLGSSSQIREYLGEEYLILEWRNVNDFASNIQNFDAALPSGGLAIYRCIEMLGTPYQTNPNGIWHGNETVNTIELVDATPPSAPFGSIDTYVSARSGSLSPATTALFGPSTGVMTYIASEPWSWKATDTFTANIQLSMPEAGKQIYAKFMNLSGQIVGTSSLALALSTNGGDTAPPSMDLNGLIEGATLSGMAHTVPTVSDNIDVDHATVQVDGTLVGTGYPAQYFEVIWDTNSFANGNHSVSVTAYDAAGNSTNITRNNIVIAN